IVALVVATRAIIAELPAVQSAGEIIGLAVSGTFLIVIGLVNVLIVVGIYRVFVELKDGNRKLNAAELEELLNKRGGVLNRLFRPRMGLNGSFWNCLADLNLQTMGGAIIVLFVVAWTVSVDYWKDKRFDERFASTERT